MENTAKKFTAREICFTAASAALIAACSQLVIPSAIPFTMQTFGVFLVLGLFGGKIGLYAVITYVLLGTAGVPVFGEFTGGLGILLGPTGGYITGFFLTAAAYALIVGNKKKSVPVTAAAMAAGLVLCYAAGTAQFMAVYSSKGESMSLMSALGFCVFPFIIPDMIKITLAILLTKRVGKYVRI